MCGLLYLRNRGEGCGIFYLVSLVATFRDIPRHFAACHGISRHAAAGPAACRGYDCHGKDHGKVHRHANPTANPWPLPWQAATRRDTRRQHVAADAKVCTLLYFFRGTVRDIPHIPARRATSRIQSGHHSSIASAAAATTVAAAAAFYQGITSPSPTLLLCISRASVQEALKQQQE